MADRRTAAVLALDAVRGRGRAAADSGAPAPGSGQSDDLHGVRVRDLASVRTVAGVSRLRLERDRRLRRRAGGAHQGAVQRLPVRLGDDGGRRRAGAGRNPAAAGYDQRLRRGERDGCRGGVFRRQPPACLRRSRPAWRPLGPALHTR